MAKMLSTRTERLRRRIVAFPEELAAAESSICIVLAGECQFVGLDCQEKGRRGISRVTEAGGGRLAVM
jgi:hypothetical protein